MKQSPPNSLDTRGFTFAVKLLVLFTLIFASGKFLFDNGLATFLEEKRQHEAQAEEVVAETEERAPALAPEPTPTRFIDDRTIEEAVPEEGKFIGANIDTMEMLLYEDGEFVREYEMYSVGRPGSRWETPSGLYKIQTKEPNHFSSIGKVWMPYSMQFHGNYFIHGWPYYPDGTEVAPGFSGGCIRLSTSDTKEVFEFAEIGTPIFVYESITEDTGGGDPENEAVKEDSNLLEKIERARGIELTNPTPPSVDAAAYLVADIKTGQVYAEKNADTSRPIASISKLMTALVANDTIASERMVTVTENAVDTYGNVANLVAGEKMTVTDMLYPLLLYSANDAARAIADYYGGDYFATIMNNQAKALGMRNTRFVEPSGLSKNNVSSANDLFKLAQYIRERKNYIFELTQTESKTVISTTPTNPRRAQTFHNIHQLRHMEGYLGGKNGYISASGQTLLTLFEVKGEDGNKHEVAIIVLGSEGSTADSLTLLSWIKKNL